MEQGTESEELAAIRNSATPGLGRARCSGFIGGLEQAHELLDGRERNRYDGERVAHVLGGFHPDQGDIDARRRAHELNRALRVGRKTLECLADDRRQSAR